MSERKRLTLFFSVAGGLLAVVILVFYLLSQEWDMIEMKRGKAAPLMWENYDEVNETDILVIGIDQEFQHLNVDTTDLFYLPRLNRIHFGLWYDPAEHQVEDAAFSVFHIKLVDDQGNVYENQSLSFGPNGWFGQFQRREISDINLDHIETLDLEIYPVLDKGGELVELKPAIKQVYNSEMDPLPTYNEYPYQKEED